MSDEDGLTSDWVPEVDITWAERRALQRAGIPIQHPEVVQALLDLVADHERTAIVHLLRAIADDVYTLDNPPQGPWWRRALFRIDQSGLRDNYAFQSRLRRLANVIESEVR